MKIDSSHVTRFSMDSSLYDEVCINCGETDGYGGKLSKPCPKPVGKGGLTLKQYGEKLLKEQEKRDK